MHTYIVYSMEDFQEQEDKEKKIQVILITVLVIISVSAVFGFTVLSLSGESNNPDTDKPDISKTYSTISADDAYSLASIGNNLTTIIDIRSCKCNYNKEHIPNAIWNINPQSFYNTTSNLIIYDNTGEKCIAFCEELVGHVYGSIYYLEGGINAWKDAGYEVV